MKKKSFLNLSVILLEILGLLIIYIGMSGPQVIWPPVITGVGFLVIGLVIYFLKE